MKEEKAENCDKGLKGSAEEEKIEQTFEHHISFKRKNCGRRKCNKYVLSAEQEK